MHVETMNDNKVIVTVAVTGSIGGRSRHPYLPISPREIVNSAVNACSAGASVAHIHVRDPVIGEPSMTFELYHEVFDMGHIAIGHHLLDKGLVESPPIFQLCLGIQWGIPATTKNMLMMREALPPEAIWAGFGIGPASFPMVTQSALLGGTVRVGFEDNFYLSRGIHAESNAQLVERAVDIVRALDREPASPQEAREMLGLT
jgi:uncharacterized protein (DUF849 family)